MTDALPAEFGAFDFGLTPDEEERARRLHAECVLVDMLFQGPCGERLYSEVELPAPTGELKEDIRAAREAPVRQALAGKFDGFQHSWTDSGVTAGNRQDEFNRPDFGGFALAQAQFDGFPWLVKAIRADDIRREKREGRVAGFLSTQDTDGIDRKLERLRVAHDLGVRMIGLTYNMQNTIGGGCTERTDTGVSNLGAALIAQMDELGIVVDTAHSGRRTTLDACELSERPVVASHTSAEALYRIDRAKSDEELQAIAETGGVIGVYAVPFFLAAGRGVTIEAMLDHIDHVAQLVGWRHVGIGTDWPMQLDRVTLETTLMKYIHEIGFRDEHNIDVSNLVGFDDYRDFPNVTRGLVARGYDDEQIAGILGENFLRVFEAVCG